ncbi:MAG TPA: hypothetical protein PKO06_16930, partial [Candidatus Ozemobacteraceae bacterium]|nr:hypothetical protein [Candidatus Ozemobacteraceae bacterium]
MIQLIREALKANRTREKVLLCAGNAYGRLLQRELLKLEPGLVNLSFTSVADYVGRTMAFMLMDKGIRVLKPGHGMLILQELIDRDGYFREAVDMPGFLIALWNCMLDLRRSGLKPEQLTAEIVGNERKAQELQILMKKFEAYLADHHLIDYAGILKLGIFERRLEQSADLILLPGHLPLEPLERQFLKQAENRLLHLPYHVPNSLAIPDSWHRECGRESPRIAQASIPADCNISLFAATEPQAEIREIIRRIRASNRPFEEMVIGLAQPAEYLSLLTSHLEIAGIPYVSAIAPEMNDSRPGRLALSLCDWALNGFPATGLIAMLNQGDLRLFRPRRRRGDDGVAKAVISSQKAIHLLREGHVRGGRDGYEKPLLAVGDSANDRGHPEIRRQVRRLSRRIGELMAKFPETGTP